MADKHASTGTRPPLHRDLAEQDRPVPKRTWRHARYGDAPEPGTAPAGPQDQTFSEIADAERTGDARRGRN